MMRALPLLGLLISSVAWANPGLAGTWKGGPMVLSVTMEGTFDWHTGDHRAGGTWKASTRLLSLVTEAGEKTYDFALEGDVLRLFEVDGTELVMQRQESDAS